MMVIQIKNLQISIIYGEQKNFLVPIFVRHLTKIFFGDELRLKNKHWLGFFQNVCITF